MKREVIYLSTATSDDAAAYFAVRVVRVRSRGECAYHVETQGRTRGRWSKRGAAEPSREQAKEQAMVALMRHLNFWGEMRVSARFPALK